jgi:hypothetical protein
LVIFEPAIIITDFHACTPRWGAMVWWLPKTAPLLSEPPLTESRIKTPIAQHTHLLAAPFSLFE